MTAVNDAIDTFCGKLVDAARDNVDDLVAAARADALDQVDTLTQELSASEAKVTDLTASLGAANAKISDQSSQISSAQSTITQLRARVAELEAQLPTPPAPVPTNLLWGSSKGDVGLTGVDQQFGGKAPLVRCFDDAGIPKSWAETDGLPSDGRPVIASTVVDPAKLPADFDAQVKAWLAGAPKGQIVAICHEGDAKVRKGEYTQAQWIALQERFLPLAAAAGMRATAILTYQSLENGTAASFWTPKMLAAASLLAFDSYQPGVPSATPAKMIGKMAPFAASVKKPFVIPEMGIGLANAPGTTDAEKDQARAKALTLVLQEAAKLVSPDPNVGLKGGCYWPAGNFIPGAATWKAITAKYPVNA